MYKAIAIFASGAGSNAARLMDFFAAHDTFRVGLIVTNKPTAGVCNEAVQRNVPVQVISSENMEDGTLLKSLAAHSIFAVVLGGFLKKIPAVFIENFAGKIYNIHPSLLPKYGGPGMYGAHVHKAVYEAKEQESGITIHEVNAKYDDGEILFQASASIANETSASGVEKKVRELEALYFAIAIEEILTQSVPNKILK